MTHNTDSRRLTTSTAESGTIDRDDLDGGIDLHLTLASGQSYRWRRIDGRLFDPPSTRPTPWYETVADGTVVRVRETVEGLEYHGTEGVESAVYRLLRLDDDLDAILDAGPTVDVYHDAVERCRGMRLVRDSLYVGLLSFICSTNMRVERIHEMVRALMRQFGPVIEFDGRSHHGFPDPATLAAASEAELRDCNLGYRAPYVRETAAMIADGEVPLPPADLGYEARREALTAYHGAGPKVADCALLFGAGDLEAVPLDRWIQRAIEAHFPGCVGDSYAETSSAIREALGPYPGYAQTYLFHHLRTSGSVDGA